MSKSRVRNSTSRTGKVQRKSTRAAALKADSAEKRAAQVTAPDAPPPEQVDDPTWDASDQLKLDVSRLKALARALERALDALGPDMWVGDFRGEEVASLAGLLHARLEALDKAVWSDELWA